MHHPDRGTPAARSFYTTMAYTNHLLFNNSFLDRLTFPPDEVNAAWDFILKTCRDYYRAADFSTPKAVTDSLVRPLLQIQGLDLTPPVWRSRMSICSPRHGNLKHLWRC